jgi:hypothetical protein
MSSKKIGEYKMSTNEWLRMNQRKIDNMQHMLTELAYKNENPGLPIGEIRGLIGAAIVEIKKLQKELDVFKAKAPNPPPETPQSEGDANLG